MGICDGIVMKIVDENALLNGQYVTIKTGRDKLVTISRSAADVVPSGKVLTLETTGQQPNKKSVKILEKRSGTLRYTVFEYEEVEVLEQKNNKQHHKNNNTREKQCPRHR